MCQGPRRQRGRPGRDSYQPRSFLMGPRGCDRACGRRSAVALAERHCAATAEPAVVDLLATGVDVPTIGKDSFRIFDAVGLYDTLQSFTAMKPVVVNPKIHFSQLLEEIQRTEGDDWQLVREQLIAKLCRKQRHLSDNAEARFRLLSGGEPEAFIEPLQQLPEAQARVWLGRIGGQAGRAAGCAMGGAR